MVMKETYIIPCMYVRVVTQELPLAVSGVTSNNGIGYGGVDEDGSHEADVKGNPYGESIFE